MKVAILETGRPPRSLEPRFGSYADMFRNLLGSDHVGPSYDVANGQLPENPRDHQAYLVTGSAAGVYDQLSWISELKAFLTSAKGEARLVGICFGHQIMAETFGGAVAKSPKGWGIGLQEYRLLEHPWWVDSDEQVAGAVSHQDQVIEPPPCSTVVAGSEFCEIGIIEYHDQPAISFQFHPEFEPDYAAALINLRRDRLIGADAALESLKGPNDHRRVADWIKAFVDGNSADAQITQPMP